MNSVIKNSHRNTVSYHQLLCKHWQRGWGGFKLLLGSLFVLVMLFINGINPTAVPNAKAIPLTFFLDWGALPNTPAGYPYVEMYTNVGGSGVDVTVSIPVIGQDEDYRDSDPGTDGNPNTYMGDPDVFRYWYQQFQSGPVAITIDFSQPVVIDEMMIGGNRQNGGANGVVEFAAYDALAGAGNVVLPNPAIYADPSATAKVASPAALPGTAPLNIIDGGANYFVEYVPARQSYVSIGGDNVYQWAVYDYEGVVVQSLVWEEYCTDVTDPQTARANVIACNFNSAYLGGFSFAPAQTQDWGDLPDGSAGTAVGNYNTNKSDVGPSHVLDGTTYLGSCVDGEVDGQPNATAVGDDSVVGVNTTGTCAVPGDDEDGILPTGNWSDGIAELDITASGAACLNVWLDFTDGTAVGSDGDFNDSFGGSSEHVIQNLLVAGGVNNRTFTLPANVADNATFFLRARLTPQDSGSGCASAEAYGGSVASPLGLAVGGEVEDYQIGFSVTAITMSNIEANDASSSLWALAAALLFALTVLFIVLQRWRKAHVGLH